MATKPAAAPSAASSPVSTFVASLKRPVKALVPVNYDQVSKEPGEVFEVRASDLGQLLEVNAVELAEDAAD